MQFVSAAHLDLKLYNYALSKILCNFVVNILNKKKKIPVNCVYIQKVFNMEIDSDSFIFLGGHSPFECMPFPIID